MKTYFILAFLVMTVSCGDMIYWDYVQAKTNYVAVTNSTAWIANRLTSGTGGYKAYYWNDATQAWVAGSLYCSQVALTTLYLYCIQSDGTVIKVSSQGFGTATTLTFKASDLKANTFGQVWYVSQTAVSGGLGNTVYMYNETTDVSTLVNSNGATKISPSPDGYAWLINSNLVIQRYNGATWTTFSGAGYDIVVGLDGNPNIMSTTAYINGWLIQRWNPTTSSWFSLVGMDAINFAVDGYNQIYIVTYSYDIMRWKGTPTNICPCKFILKF